MKKLYLLFLATATLSAMAAQNSVSLKYGLTSIDNDSSSKFKNNTFSLDGIYGIDYPIQPRFDLSYAKIKDKEKWGGVSSLLQLAISGQYETSTDYKLSPYVFGGVGYESVSSSTICFDSNPFLQLGTGLKYALTPKVNLLGEFKALQILGGDNQDNEFIFSLGANIPLYASEKERPTPTTTLSTKSIINDTPKEKIAPAVVAVRESVIVDSDKDGVPDDKDDCPNTVMKKDTIVGKNGCEIIVLLDSDNDGITDDIDKCPNTPFGLRKNVDSMGCAKSETIQTPSVVKTTNNTTDIKAQDFAKMGDKINLHISFDSNLAKIKPEYQTKIKEFAKYIKSLGKDTVVTINGYTDSSGNEAKNKKLSRERAFAVRQALIKAGLKPSQVRAYGNGSLNPIASNDTAEGRAKNRRIEAIIAH